MAHEKVPAIRVHFQNANKRHDSYFYNYKTISSVRGSRCTAPICRIAFSEVSAHMDNYKEIICAVDACINQSILNILEEDLSDDIQLHRNTVEYGFRTATINFSKTRAQLLHQAAECLIRHSSLGYIDHSKTYVKNTEKASKLALISLQAFQRTFPTDGFEYRRLGSTINKITPLVISPPQQPQKKHRTHFVKTCL